MPCIRILLFSISIFSTHLFAQDFDKKLFCQSLQTVWTAFGTDYDSLKGEYIGANAFGIQQWKCSIPLYGSVAGTYDYSTYLSTEYRATFVMKEQEKKTAAETLYKQLVNATRACYVSEFSLEEKITTEYRGGKKTEQLEALFSPMREGQGSGQQNSSIRISSTAYETGETFEVLVELIKLMQ